ncbi:hypothetical protein C8J57DRAFT_1267804 [Mycena rebaudengoi]|nr:hypothetical protein C8J57DRAFT_1267804 [Mycena rebaudengoi]
MHIILTGATGSVGEGVLRNCLASPHVTHLSILTRRQFALPQDGLNTEKAQIIVHEDYTSYPSNVMEMLKGAEGCVWAQGISQSQVSKEDYIRITYDYPMAAAKAFSVLSDKFNFVYVSGEGADPTEKTPILFGKIKGRAETALLALPSTPSYTALRVFNVRPGAVVPLHPRHNEFKHTVTRTVIVPILRTLMPSQVSPVDVLAKALVGLATGDGEPLPAGRGIEAGGRTVRSVAVLNLGKLQ